MIKQAGKNADFTEIGAMVGNKLNTALNSIPGVRIKIPGLTRLQRYVATFLNGFLETVDWKLVGNTLAQGTTPLLVWQIRLPKISTGIALGKQIG